jgi:hypothetical protein
VLSCAELTDAAGPPRRVIVVGRTGSASAEPLRAPISGQECVWYRVVLMSGGPGSIDRSRSVFRSSEPFTVTDSTGAVRVAARLVDRYLFENDLYHDLVAFLWLPSRRCRARSLTTSWRRCRARSLTTSCSGR